jgi:hypothetical protein
MKVAIMTAARKRFALAAVIVGWEYIALYLPQAPAKQRPGYNRRPVDIKIVR